MKGNHHDTFQRMIDESLAGAISAAKEQSLREHLATCARCEAYLSANYRVIEGLGGFRFEINSSLDARIVKALRLHAEGISKTTPKQTKKMRQHNVQTKVWAALAVATSMSILGSIVVYRVAKFLTVPMQFDTAQVQLGVLVFWLLPSFCAVLGILAAPPRDRSMA